MTRREMELLIEPALAGDAGPCFALLSGWSDETEWMPRLRDPVEYESFLHELIGRGWITLVRNVGQVVGFLVRDRAEIHALYLDRVARRQGIGKALLDHAKDQEEHLALWAFEANKAAQLFYLREGFREVGRSDGAGNDEGLPDIRYEWRKRDG